MALGSEILITAPKGGGGNQSLTVEDCHGLIYASNDSDMAAIASQYKTVLNPYKLKIQEARRDIFRDNPELEHLDEPALIAGDSESFYEARDVLRAALMARAYASGTLDVSGERILEGTFSEYLGAEGNLFHFKTTIPISGADYKTFLTTRQDERVPAGFSGYFDSGHNRFCIEVWANSPDPKAYMSRLSDGLFSFHMSAVQTVVMDGGFRLLCPDYVSSIFSLAFFEASETRVLACGHCGKPVIAGKERGKKREYCSDLCKQRAYRERKTQTKDEQPEAR